MEKYVQGTIVNHNNNNNNPEFWDENGSLNPSWKIRPNYNKQEEMTVSVSWPHYSIRLERITKRKD